MAAKSENEMTVCAAQEALDMENYAVYDLIDQLINY
jgi:hypothetical protein